MGERSETTNLTDLNIATADFMEALVSQINYDNLLTSRLLGKSKSVEGGEKISVPMLYGEADVETTSEYEQYDIQPKELLDYAYYDWKTITGTMALSRNKVDVQNVGKAKLIDLARAKVENLSETFRKKFSTLQFTPVASMKATDPDNLIKICATTNNTVGGINASTETRFDWNPKVLDYSSASITHDDLVDPTSIYYIERILRRAFGPLTIDKDKPTLVLTTQGIWDTYEEVLAAKKTLNDNIMTVDGGFDVLRFRKCFIAVDNNVPGGKLNEVSDNGAMMLILNEKYLGYRHSPAVEFLWTKWKKSESQPVYFSLLEWVGSFICSRRDRQGAVLGLPTDAQIYV